jgi:hypothetical protein
MACKSSFRDLQAVAAFALLVATNPADGLQNGLGLTPQMVRPVRCLLRIRVPLSSVPCPGVDVS